MNVLWETIGEKGQKWLSNIISSVFVEVIKLQKKALWLFDSKSSSIKDSKKSSLGSRIPILCGSVPNINIWTEKFEKKLLK